MTERRKLKPGFRIGASFEARFSDDASMLVTLGMRPTVWDVAARRKLGTTPLLSHASHADFSPDGQKLAIKNTAGSVMVVDVPSLEEMGPRYGSRYGEGSDLRFSPCGKYLIDGSWSGHLLVRDVLTGETVWDEHDDDVAIYRLRTVRARALCLYDRAARYPGAHRHFLREWPFWANAAVELNGLCGGSAAAISEDGSKLALQGPRLNVYDIADPLECRLTASRDGMNKALAWSPTGAHLAVAGDGGGSVYTSDLELLSFEPLEYVSDADWSKAGDLIVFGDWSHGIVLPAP